MINLVRISGNRVTLTVPQFVNYALVAHGSERIQALALPATCVTSGVELTLQTGQTYVDIIGRTAAFSGTWFSPTDKLDDHVRSNPNPNPNWFSPTDKLDDHVRSIETIPVCCLNLNLTLNLNLNPKPKH